MKKLFLIINFLIVFLFFTSSVFAAETFTTDYVVNYEIKDTVSTHVIVNVSLKNNTTQYYASSYKIQFGFSNINNLYASDAEGKLNPKINKLDKGTEIELNFNKKVVGIDNKLDFTITFDTDEVARKTGNIWEVNIPGVTNQNFSSFTVNVIYPEYIGKPTFIKPAVLAKETGNKITFNRNQLGEGGISIAFGEFQIYNFTLRYNILNKNLFPVKTEIALPPNTNYQDVIIDSINPKPTNVITDKDGNWLAEYKLYPSEKKQVTVTGKSKISINPKQQNLSNQDRVEYLKVDEFWEVNNSKIKQLAKDLKTPRAIYDYVVATLSYDFSRVAAKKLRLGAVESLRLPESAVCLEFTDLFIAIARSAGIPARELNGFANTENQEERPLLVEEDILHAWPEYYDDVRRTWIMVDPTWGNTTGGIDFFDTFDFDHFVFVIKGRDSSYPIPAGGYKFSSSEKSKNVSVVPAEIFKSNINLDIESSVSQKIVSWLPVKTVIRVKNNGGAELKKQSMVIDSTILKITNPSLLIDSIPPFGHLEIPVEFEKSSILTNKEGNIKIRVGSFEATKKVIIAPIFLDRYFAIGGGIVASFIVILSLIVFKSRSLFIFKQKGDSYLRGEGKEFKN
ncbi:transglutaminase family protein [Patescibacteria group bacterium]|nr:transglutaminase family protein [Patescibacteria group bacterium]